MVRTQIQLSERQARELREAAFRHGVSLAEMVRRCVDRTLADEQPRREGLYEAAARQVGRWRDREGAEDLARDHDRYLGEAFR